MAETRTEPAPSSVTTTLSDTPPTLAGLYDAHARWMYRHALMLLADHAAAEDAMQQVFTKLAAMGTRLGTIANDRAYLRRALRGECYRLLKRATRRRDIEARHPMLESAGTQHDPAEHEALQAALRRLPPQQREVVHLKVYEGMTFADLAAALDIPANTAASRYRYAIEKLRAILL